MPVFHQMGNDSENLVFERELSHYAGAVLSPVNYDRAGVARHVTRMRGLSNFETVFDPQLYVPRSEMGQLPSWDYFPRDVDTADLSNAEWWARLVGNVARTAVALNVHSVCSPAIVPAVYSDSYYLHTVANCSALERCLNQTGIAPLLTAVVGMTDVSQRGRALEITSILSRSDTERVFLIFKSDIEPRRELADPESLKGAMKIIASLRNAGMKVLVGFCSSDMVLWKAAGAHSCATGKFFNLRRFMLTRFAEPSAGGGQVPYWFEENLLAFYDKRIYSGSKDAGC